MARYGRSPLTGCENVDSGVRDNNDSGDQSDDGDDSVDDEEEDDDRSLYYDYDEYNGRE